MKFAARSVQIPLPGFDWKKSQAFGGAGKAKGNPRTARPIAVKRPMHLVMKSAWMKLSTSNVGGVTSLILMASQIEKITRDVGNKTLVQLRDIAVAHDHVHLVIQPKSIYAYRRFIRALSGILARTILDAQKGRAWRKASSLKHFWQARPFTRIVEWGKDYVGIKNYVMKNRLDLLGIDRLSAHEMLQKIAQLRAEQNLISLGFS